MLLHGDGTNGAQNNTFLDSSTNNFTITRNGNTTQGTFSPYGNLWSNYFDGSGDYLTSASSSVFAYGTGDFTWEFWLYPTASNWGAGNHYLLDHGSNGGTLSYGNSLRYYNATTGMGSQLYTNGGVISAGTWSHILVSRASGTTRVFVNGQLRSSGADSHDYGTQSFTIANYGSTGYEFSGYISNLRIVKGTALYTSNFTPSTAPLTAISGTSLLTCQSNRFIDNSSNNFAITVNGNTSVQPFSPFNPTAAYSPSVNGGSGYFDGSGDWLTTPSSGQFAPAGDFTIGIWYYPTTTRTYQQILGNYDNSSSTVWVIEVRNGTSAYFYLNGPVQRFGGSGVVINSWNYIALVRSGSTITGYVNGTSVGTYTQSGTFGSASQSISIGRGGSQNTSDSAYGYISGVHLLDGTAVTTVPTAPLTAITNTSLLCNFTNAGIFDNAMKNDLETVGNAQVSTSVKKYGTGSMYFDGSGDWLTIPASENFSFGTGDFTIEFWMNVATNASMSTFDQWINNGGAYATGQCQVIKDASNRIVFYCATGTNSYVTLTGSATVTTGTFYHIAVVRYSGVVKIYINGTVDTNTLSFAGVAGVSNALAKVGVQSNSGVLPFNGYIDDLRITKGVARYTANFTPPTQAFPNK